MRIKAILLGTILATGLPCVYAAAAPCDSATEPGAVDGKRIDKDAALTAAELEQRGDIFRSQNELAEAKRYYERALKKNPRDARLWNKLGVMALRANDIDSAQSALQQAVRADKHYAEAVNNLGVVYYIKKDYPRAEASYRRAIELTDTASFHSNLGALYFDRDDPKQALEQYRIALQMDPQILERNSPTGVAARATGPAERGRYAFLLARLYAKLGDVNHSLDHLKKAVQNGYKLPEDFPTDTDFVAVRQDPRFSEAVAAPIDATQ